MFYVVSLFSLNAKGDSELSQLKRKARYEYVMKRTAELLKSGNFAYSPIAHCYEMSIRHDMPQDYTFWKEQDRHFVKLSEALIVLDMKTGCGLNWESSEGMSDEIAYAKSIGKPIIFLKADDFYDPITTEQSFMIDHSTPMEDR